MGYGVHWLVLHGMDHGVYWWASLRTGMVWTIESDYGLLLLVLACELNTSDGAGSGTCWEVGSAAEREGGDWPHGWRAEQSR